MSEARIKAHDCRRHLLEGLDPIDIRDEELRAKAREAGLAVTFDECAAKYIESQRHSWKNEKHAQQWTNTLKTYASPVIGNLPIQEVSTSLIMQILEPIWKTKTETASRVRSRLELVIAWAIVHGYRSGDNPAIWRNHLDKLLPKRSRVQKVEHHRALPFEEMGAFMSKLRAQPGLAARALELLVLTATRTSETLNAEWSEFRFDEALWIIPAERMKGGVEQRVPLSPRALEILNELKQDSDGRFVFPGARIGRPLSNTAMLKVLERMKVNFVSHGFRSSFRDWCSERTNYPREVCEQALAHTIRDKVESAYRRGDLLLKRRALMNDWGKFCGLAPSKSGDVVGLGVRQG